MEFPTETATPDNPIEQGSLSEAFANSLKVTSSEPEIGQIASPVDASSSKMEEDPRRHNDEFLDAADNVARKAKYVDMRHEFWETQPVMQYAEIGYTGLPEGPIVDVTESTKVRQIPYDGLNKPYEWTTCDFNSDEMLTELCIFLNDNFCEETNGRKAIISEEYLTWLLFPHGYEKSWHFGVCVGTKKKKLVAFIAAVPTKIQVRGQTVKMARIILLCVHKELRSKGVTTLMIKEMTRRVQLEGIWQAVYSSWKIVPTPITTCKNWFRFLDPNKLFHIGFAERDGKLTASRATRLYGLPGAPLTPGFRRMTAGDVSEVHKLRSQYLGGDFKVAAAFDYFEAAHLFEPKDDLVETYVVQTPGTIDITDFCSFTIVTSAIRGNRKHTTMKAAYSFYNVATKTSLVHLMKDALIVSKQKNCDVFWATDVMHNESFLKELKFQEGDGEGSHYYLYNYRLRSGLKPSQLGLI